MMDRRAGIGGGCLFRLSAYSAPGLQQQAVSSSRQSAAAAAAAASSQQQQQQQQQQQAVSSSSSSISSCSSRPSATSTTFPLSLSTSSSVSLCLFWKRGGEGVSQPLTRLIRGSINLDVHRNKGHRCIHMSNKTVFTFPFGVVYVLVLFCQRFHVFVLCLFISLTHSVATIVVDAIFFLSPSVCIHAIAQSWRFRGTGVLISRIVVVVL